MCIIFEYSGGMPFYPKHSYVIDCIWLQAQQVWQICVKETKRNHCTDVDAAKAFLQKLKESIN